MAKILINDGIHPTGLKMLTEAGHDVQTDKIEQDDLMAQLPVFDAICVRSATKVRTDLIDNCPNLKVIGRGGVGLDNIDVSNAKSKGIHVINTPAASSRSVAELVTGHMFTLSRFLNNSNVEMPTLGSTKFKDLKKAYSKGAEVKGKTMGIIGLGRIGCEVAKIALGLGMKVVGSDIMKTSQEISLDIAGLSIDYTIESVSMDELLANSDYISLHVPSVDKPIIGALEFSKMKDGAVILNAARGGTIDENALLNALDSGKLGGAGLDVFVNEPTPREDILNHPRISVTPHIGASTGAAQENIGIELANQLIELLG